MTTILFSNTPVPLEVTYDQPGLNVAMKWSVWNGSGWTVAGGPVTAPNSGTGSNTYGAVWTPPDNRPYMVELAVYTDGTFTVYQTGYFASSRSFLLDPVVQASLSAGRSQCGIFGQLDDTSIEAQVADNTIFGVVEQC